MSMASHGDRVAQVGGLAVVSAGDGGPVVLLEAGLGSPATSWAPVQRALSGTTRTLAYDRAGLGSSAPASRERTLAHLAEELAALLDGLGVNQPVVVVAHSWGAAIVRCFTATYPELVAGIVLVDGTISAVTEPRVARLNARAAGALARLARSGLHRPLVRASVRKSTSALSSGEHAALMSDLLSSSHLRGTAAEAAGVESSLPQLKDVEDQGLPDVPVTAVIGGRMGRGSAASMRRTLLDRARQEMSAHRQGTLVVAGKSGHAVPTTEPVCVVDAVLDVLRRVSENDEVRTSL